MAYCTDSHRHYVLFQSDHKNLTLIIIMLKMHMLPVVIMLPECLEWE